KPSNGPQARLSGRWVAMYFVAALMPSDRGLLGAFGQIEVLAMRREDCISASGGPIGRGPIAVEEIVVIGGVLDHAVQRDVFEKFELSHCVSFHTGLRSPAAPS